jgi:hypothetical protein
MKDFVIITNIIPVDSKNRGIVNIKIQPVLLGLPRFKQFYDLQFNQMKKDIPNLMRLDFYYFQIVSPYIN